jgi:hypothetical protein
LLVLLTDALRDGPGSPAWHAAMQRLDEVDETKNSGAPVDEYRRLCQAREHLESGKDFRSVRPGPMFTQRLWKALDAEGQNHFWSTRRVLTLIAAACVLLGCAAVIWEMVPRDTMIDRDIAELSEMLFSKPLANLDTSQNGRQDWRAMGALPLVADRDLTLPTENSHPLPAGGGFVMAGPIAADEPFAIEAKFEINRSTSDLVPEIAVSDVDAFGNATGSSPHELVIALEGKQAKVVAPDGRLAAQGDMQGDGRGELTFRFRIDQQVAIIEMNGRLVFHGANGLSATGKRFVAVRILRRGSADAQNISLRSLRVLTAP